MFAKIRSAFRGFFFPSWSVPIALLVLTILGYGLRALSLGFYWDDWPYLWFFHRFGAEGITSAFSGDRPFLSFIYTLSLTALGNSSQGWQIFGLFARWLCGLGFWFALAQAWPRNRHKAAWAALLFTIYPGFTQQWISVIYGQAFFLYSLIFFSIGLTLWLVRRRAEFKPGYLAAGTLLALALSAFTMFSTEYFFGIELLRPILLWLVLAPVPASAAASTAGLRSLHRQPWLQQTRQAAIWWAPYLALMIIFVLWRVVLHPFTGYRMTTLEAAETAPIGTLVSLGLKIVQDTIVSSLAAWGQPLQILPGFLEANTGQGLRLLFVILLTGILSVVYLIRLHPRPYAQTDTAQITGSGWGLQAVIVGIILLLASGWPTWITGLPMRMGFPLDRYSLAMSAGVSLALAGLVDLAGRDLPRKAAVIGLALALAAGFHFQTALSYEQDWADVRSFFWQLTWRAPQVKPNTVFATTPLNFRYFEDDSLTAPLNWVYDPLGKGQQMSYILYDLQVRSKSLPSLKPDLPVEHNFRATSFSGNTSQMLFFYYAPPGCLRILDPRYDAELYDLPGRLIRGMQASAPQAVITDSDTPAQPMAEIFGDEPKHRWCYFYEKAELARQNSDWEVIRKLGRQSIGEGFRPEDPVEYLPFIEGYARIGLPDDALQLSYAVDRESPALRPGLCAVWRRTYEANPALDPKYRSEINQSFNCTIP